MLKFIDMQQNTKQNIPYTALVKFEVGASHFAPSYSFCQYFDNSAAEVVESIIDEFLSRVDHAICCEDGSDEDIQSERVKLEKSLRKFSDDLQIASDELQIENLGASICVGYPTYEFSVVAAGPDNEYLKRVLPALEVDTHFSDFLECQLADLEDVDDTHLSDEQALVLEFQRLRTMDPEELNKENTENILSRIEELVRNEEM
jgi:hypothetical protein